MKIVKPAIALALLLSCLSAQSMEFLKAARHHPYISTAIVGAGLYKAYQAKNAIMNVYEKNQTISQNKNLLNMIYEMTANTNKLVQHSFLEKIKPKVAHSLNFAKNVAPFVGMIPAALPELEKAWRSFVVIACAYDTEASYNETTLAAFNDAYSRLMAELAPMVEFSVTNIVKNAAVAGTVYVGKTAMSLPSAAAGLFKRALNSYKVYDIQQR